MKKTKKLPADELRPEYKRSDFGALVRGKYADRLKANSNIVVIDPEVAGLFPNAAAVNSALRSLAEIAQRTRPPDAGLGTRKGSSKAKSTHGER